MPMMQNGLAKLIEECGEVQQIAGKLVQYPHLQQWNTELHPDGTHLLTELTNEIADIRAATDFVIAKLGLATVPIADRSKRKLELFQKWDAERPAQETSVEYGDCPECRAGTGHAGKRIHLAGCPAANRRESL